MIHAIQKCLASMLGLACLVAGSPLIASESYTAASQKLTDSSNPVSVVEALQNALMAFHESRISAAELEATILGTHDLERLSRLAVGVRWHQFSDEQRERVHAAFRDLTIASYTNRFGRAQELSIETLESEATAPGRYQVTSRLLLTDQREYVFIFHLANTDAKDWRIVNILAEGVSDLALKQREFRPYLNDGGPDALVQELIHQIALLNAIPASQYNQNP